MVGLKAVLLLVNMVKKTFNIIGGFGKERDSKIASQRIWNMYAIDAPQGKTGHALAPMPGLTQGIVLLTGSPVRDKGLSTFKDNLYAAIGNKIYNMDKTGDTTFIGNLSTIKGVVDMESNQHQIIFVDGSKGYIFDLTTSSYSEITSAGFPNKPETVAFLDGYFIVNAGETNQFNVSALNDGTTWDALNFALMQSQPDIIIGLTVLKRRLYIFGNTTTEVWYDAGAADFPLRRDDNMLLQYGAAARGSIANGYGKLFWLAGDPSGVGSIMMTDGSVPQIISTPAVDYQIQSYPNISDAVGIVYKINGHIFYELSFTEADATWIYDATTNIWFEGITQDRKRRVANSHAFFNGKHFVGSYLEPKVYELSPTTFTDENQAVPREVITPHFADPDMRKITINRFNLDIVAGVGVPNGSYENPEVFLSVSRDGGVTFGNRRRATLGTQGDRTHRCMWHNLGAARDWVFKLECITKSNFTILGSSIDFEIGVN